VVRTIVLNVAAVIDIAAVLVDVAAVDVAAVINGMFSEKSDHLKVYNISEKSS